MNNHVVTLAVTSLLIIWVVSRRIRRTIGFQLFVRRRLYVRISVISVLGALLLASGILHPLVYAGDAAGLVAGSVLAFVALRFLTFEKREDDWYYRSNVWVESAVLVLFLARLVLRVWEVVQHGGQQNAAQADDPLTAGAIFMFISYYVAFSVGVLRKQQSLGDAGAI